jgi:hypothetical protein
MKGFTIKLAFLATSFLCAWINTAAAKAFEVIVYQSANLYFNSGEITLRDPVSDEVLGTYQFASGGFGRGSAPFGHYEIGRFRKDGWIGPRWEIRQRGLEDGEAWDSRIRSMRTGIELHMMHGPGHIKGTLGCIGVLGGPEVWAEFRKHLRYIRSLLGVVQFDFNALPVWALA